MMPAAQVILLQAMSQYHEIIDPAAYAFFLPYPEAMRGLQKAEAALEKLIAESPRTIPLALIHVKPMQTCRTAQARVEREFAVLQLLEALRLYAAEHGRLPQQLGDLASCAAPRDPVTGKPFEYRLDQKTARLEGLALPGQQHTPLDYEIVMAPVDK
jgi:hypothetical protein